MNPIEPHSNKITLQSSTPQTIKLAVYGTLRKGYGNYYHFLQESSFLGIYTTQNKYRLIISDYPCVLPHNGEGYHIVVDVFEINLQTLIEIDQFENHPIDYERHQISLHTGTIAWIYTRDITDNGIHLKEYLERGKA
jgi:gamma-glutamylcyclotransferase (GGCT)/AIG2-like uncharacterized protein YtfP|tara:strand:+ start:608 stop:1018 length:411 start_codon:yes stop_codon:yes gene_type:complete